MTWRAVSGRPDPEAEPHARLAAIGALRAGGPVAAAPHCTLLRDIAIDADEVVGPGGYCYEYC